MSNLVLAGTLQFIKLKRKQGMKFCVAGLLHIVVVKMTTFKSVNILGTGKSYNAGTLGRQLTTTLMFVLKDFKDFYAFAFNYIVKIIVQ